MIDQALAQALQKEIPILTAQIRSLYAEFDKKISSQWSEDSHYLWYGARSSGILYKRQLPRKKSIFIFPCCLSATR